MKTNTVTLSITSLAFLFSAYSAAADDDDENALFKLGLKELLAINVSVASVEVESITETPAIVSRYEREDLELMGISTLREMFNFVPGVIVKNSITGIGAVQIRGIDEAFNQKVLFLLDGIPYHQPSHSIIPLEGIVWESISHIEVIRGPGTVLHGTQASGGVINVITKQSPEYSSLYAKVGTDNLREVTGIVSHSWGEHNQLSLSGEVRREGGEVIPYDAYFPDVGIITDDIFREQEKDALLFKFNTQHINFLAHAFTDKTIGINDAYADENTLQPFITESDSYLIHLDAHWQTEKLFGKFYTDYNFYTFDFTIKNLFAPNVDALVKKQGKGEKDYRFRVGAEANYKFNDSMLLTAGIEQETRSSDRYNLYLAENPSSELATLIDSDKSKELAVYSQLDINLGKWRYVLGGRYTDHELSGTQLSPRLGAIYSYDDKQTFKALYSTGYNSPNPLQTNINLPGNVVGDPKLKAEIVSSLDLVYSYSESHLLFVANIYKMKAKDFIIRRYSDSLASVSFFNEGFYSREGAELDFQIVYDDLKIFANMAYVKQGNSEINHDPDAFRVAKHTLSSGLSYNITDQHSVGTNISFIGKRADLGSYAVYGFNYTASFTHFDVVANIYNAFGKKVRNPNNSSQNSSLVALDEIKANYELGLRFSF